MKKIQTSKFRCYKCHKIIGEYRNTNKEKVIKSYATICVKCLNKLEKENKELKKQKKQCESIIRLYQKISKNKHKEKSIEIMKDIREIISKLDRII